jgi:hypothetical protein
MTGYGSDEKAYQMETDLYIEPKAKKKSNSSKQKVMTSKSSQVVLPKTKEEILAQIRQELPLNSTKLNGGVKK